MRSFLLLAAGVLLAPLSALAAPAGSGSDNKDLVGFEIFKRENLCSLKSPPAICKPDPTVSVEETATRAYKFYKAFVVDGDPKTMFSLIDSVYKVRQPTGDDSTCRWRGSMLTA